MCIQNITDNCDVYIGYWIHVQIGGDQGYHVALTQTNLSIQHAGVLFSVLNQHTTNGGGKFFKYHSSILANFTYWITEGLNWMA